MNRHAQHIIKTMMDGKPIPSDLQQELDETNRLTNLAGGSLVSRQVIAAIIARYHPKD